MLDLFSGTGAASAAMRERGWRTTTVELDAKFKPDVVADIQTYRYRGPRPDLLWASPPCTEFSREDMPWTRTGKTPSLDLWLAALRLVHATRPKFWVIENTRGAQRWMGRAPAHYGPVYLWGYYPRFSARVEPWKETLSSKRRDLRAAIPLSISLALAKAVERELR